MAYDEDLAQRVREVMAERTGVVEKKMFGGVSFMLDGNMACGVIGDDLIVRVGPQQYETAVMSPHARPFDFTGKPMKGWIVVAAAGVTSDADLAQWVQRGVAFAHSLPPK
jgi:TfoX/Sxy family transcriptional regulator of competence genes